MLDKQAKLGRFGVAILAVLSVAAALSGRAYTQYRASLKSAWMTRHALQVVRAEMAREQTGAPDDWSHRHLVFSNPGTEESAIQNGRYDSWLNITNDPRFILQQKKRAVGSKKLADRDVFGAAATGAPPSGSPLGTKGGKTGGSQAAPIHRDWAIGLGTGSPTQVAYPAKWSFDTTTASCSADFVAYPTGAAGAAGQASIIAYFNLYTGCGGTVPTVAWAFNTAGTITGAPVFSIDGKQLAFVQATAGVATLVLLKLPTALPGSGTLTGPTTLPTIQTATTYPTCTAPCMLRLAFTAGPTDTLSNPWVDYASDSLFVGDDAGKLHKFSPVFTGTAGTPAAEITTSWPVTLAASALGSPVFDSGTGKVFVGNATGIFYAIGGGTPSFLPGVVSGHIYGASSDLGASTNEIVDAPLVDSAAGEAYVFVQADSTGHNAVFQFPTSFTSGTGVEKQVGTFTRDSEYELSGAFDNIYINSESSCSSSCTPTGNLYLTGSTSVDATLYQIPIAANVMGTVHTGPVIGDTGFFGRSSPVTEFVTDSPATATVTINTNPGGVGPWANATRAVTVGSVKYTFVTGTPAASTATAVQVRVYTLSFATTNEANTASNLAAAINADSTLCAPGTVPCFGSGTVANASATATYPGAGGNTEVDLTAAVTGSAGTFTASNSGSTTTGIVVSTVTSGTTVDSIYVSTYSDNNNGSGNGCSSGCVYSFDVTSGATMTGTTAPSATLPVTANIANADGYATGGILIDNDVSSTTLGTQQIYFLSLNNATGVTCATSGSRICATQASQSGLN